MGLVPVFVDVDPETMNINFDDFARKISPKTKGVVFVHILGNSGDVSSDIEFSTRRFCW